MLREVGKNPASRGSDDLMIDIYVYGKLRQFADSQDPSSASVIPVPWQDDDTVGSVVDRLGIPVEQIGSNVFLNGRYANLESSVQDGDRLGLFPDDMQLLYKWYFAPQDTAGAPNQDSAVPMSSNEDEK